MKSEQLKSERGVTRPDTSTGHEDMATVAFVHLPHCTRFRMLIPTMFQTTSLRTTLFGFDYNVFQEIIFIEYITRDKAAAARTAQPLFRLLLISGGIEFLGCILVLKSR